LSLRYLCFWNVNSTITTADCKYFPNHNLRILMFCFSLSLYFLPYFPPPYCQYGRRASEISTAELQLPTLDPSSSESHVVNRPSAFCTDELGVAEITQD
jgi:hypothetical protein